MNDSQPDTQTDTSSEASTDGAAKDVKIEPGPPPSEPIDDGSQAFARVGVVVAAVAAVLAVLRLIRLRRPEPTPKDKLAEATQQLSTAAVGLGGRAARRTAEVAGPVAKDAASVARKTAEVAGPVAKDAAAVALVAAHEAATRAGSAAEGASRLAAGTAHDAAGLASEGVRKVGAVAAEGVREVADGVESVQKAWHKLVTRIIVVVFGSAGYVLGARAGRDRYEQIVSAAQRAQAKIQGG